MHLWLRLPRCGGRSRGSSAAAVEVLAEVSDGSLDEAAVLHEEGGLDNVDEAVAAGGHALLDEREAVPPPAPSPLLAQTDRARDHEAGGSCCRGAST